MMFEINLVPDIKGELLKKQRMRNLVIFISICVGAGSVGVVALLGSIVGGQNLVMAGQDREILCRSEGSKKKTEREQLDECPTKNYGTPIMKVDNLNEFLTIQDQMKKISSLNENKMLLSRVFGVLDVILPVGDDKVEISDKYDGKSEIAVLHEPKSIDIIEEIGKRAAVILLTQRNERDFILSAYDAGMHDFCSPDAGDYELTIRILNAVRLHDALAGNKRHAQDESAISSDATVTGAPKLFKKIFDKKVESVIEPVFYRTSRQYGLTQDTPLSLHTADGRSRLEVVHDGAAKAIIRVSHAGLDSPENYDKKVLLSRLSQSLLERFIRDFAIS